MLFVRETPEGIIFKVFIQPRSSKNMITGLYGDALKIKIAAPPVDGAANDMCIRYLSKCLKCAKSSVEIISGHTGRTKQILLRYKGDKAEPERTKCLIENLFKK